MIERVLIVLCGLITMISVSAQDTVLVNVEDLTTEKMDSLGYRNYPVPSKLYIPSYGGNVESPDKKNVNKGDIYTIGWSSEGHFAYVLEPYVENNESYYAEVYIHDLKNDSIVWFYAYENEAWENAWNAGDEKTKDSLRNTFTCYYLKCMWYSIYPEVSKALFDFGVEPYTVDYRARRVLNKQKYSHTSVDTTDDGFVGHIDLFFEYDVDTFKFAYPIKDPVYGVNFHGSITDNENTDWYAMILSERHHGLDTAESESWRYRFLGYKRDMTLPFDTTYVDLKAPGYYLHSDTVSRAYRKVSLIEQMGDRVVNMDEQKWYFQFGNELDVSFEGDDKSSYSRSKSFRETIENNGITYRRHKTIYRDNFIFYFYGQADDEDALTNLTQLVCYDKDSGDVAYWYDFTGLMENGNGSLRWLETKDSLIYVSFGTDSVVEGEKCFGKIMCIDTDFGRVLWQSESDCINSESFAVVNDVIIGGFAGEERDHITFINRINGTTIRKITLLSDPLWVVRILDNLYIRTALSNHEFKIESTFFESYDQ